MAVCGGLLPIVAAIATPLAAAVNAGFFLAALDAPPPDPPASLRIGPLDVRVMGSGAPLLLVHGVHPEGATERRLLALGAALADEGFEVFIPELRPLQDLEFSASLVDDLEETGRVIQAERGELGVVGISVGGAVALRVHAQAGWSGAVLTVGAPFDLAELANVHSEDEHGYARRVLDALQANRDELRRLGPLAVDARVFVLHGQDDPLVPASQSARLCELTTCERLLVTPWLGHADREGQSPWPVLRFTAEALAALRSSQSPSRR